MAAVLRLPSYELEGLSWLDVERYLQLDTRLAFALGATEEHAHLSLATDTRLVAEIARRATAAEHVLLAPLVPFGNSIWAAHHPGTLWVTPTTLGGVLRDLIASAHATGFRRILVISGHSGNDVVSVHLQGLMASLDDLVCDYFAWYREPEVLELARSIREDGLDHANWGENIPATRLPEHAAPTEPQTAPRFRRDYVLLHPREVRAAAPGGMHGRIARIPDEEAAPVVDCAVRLACERLRRLAA